MRTFIGIDPSLTGTGLAEYEGGDDFRTHTVTSQPAGGICDRLWRYDRLLGKVINWLPTAINGICIEGYSYGSKGRGLLDRIEFGGILRHYLICDRQYAVIEVPPATLKLFICGKGGGPGTQKADVRMAVYQRWKLDFCDPDQCDAYVLARMAACLWASEEPANDAQRRALAKLRLKPIPHPF